MLRSLAAVWIAITAGAASVAAQATRAEASFRTELIELSSASRTYNLRVMLPPGHDTTSGGLPVLYYLDAWWWGGLAESLVRMSALAHPPRVEPLILVGISSVGDADEFNRARNRDFTPSPYTPIAPGVQMRTGNVLLDSAGTGMAREFLAFLEQDVLPAIEGRYNVAEGARGIAGHSYGGLFAAWTFTVRPDLFDRYLIISPATYWNDSEVLRTGVFQGAAEPRENRVFLATGGGEWSIMRRSADSLAVALEGFDSTELQRQEYDGADHMTVLPRALMDGLLYLFGR